MCPEQIETRLQPVHQPWLMSARWDLSVLVGSVSLAVVPYCVYVALSGSDSRMRQ